MKQLIFINEKTGAKITGIDLSDTNEEMRKSFV